MDVLDVQEIVEVVRLVVARGWRHDDVEVEVGNTMMWS